MNKIYLPVFIVLTLTLSDLGAQSSYVPAELSMAFKAGNTDKIIDYLNTTVELVISDKEDFYSKKVAGNILKEFFSEHKVKDFIIKHQGGKNNASFAIGNLKTSGGTFRVYFLIKAVQDKPLIHQLRIEKDDSGSN